MKSTRTRIALFVIPLAVVGTLALGAERKQPAIMEGSIDPTCVSGAPCIEYDNNGAGLAIRGVGLTGNGVGGVTKQNSTSSSNGKSGVVGFDVSSTGTFDSGVLGISQRGTGVTGTSNKGNGVIGTTNFDLVNTGMAGVWGQDINPNSVWNWGVYGSSMNGTGVFGTSYNATAVDGESQYGYGVVGVLHHIGPAAVLGYDAGSVGNYAVQAISTNGYGVVAESDNTGGGTVAALVADAPSGANIIKGESSSGTVLTLGPSGDLIIAGKIYTAGGCSGGCLGTHRIESFGTIAASPTIEDTGEAQLVNGLAYVRLDSTFARTIDQQHGYSVFITPEGDNRGLYVTQKSLNGFAVHESMSGRSTLPFAYRIVAHPYGSPSVRQSPIDIRNTDRPFARYNPMKRNG